MRSSLMLIILLVGLTLTLMTFLGRLWWGFELATHFKAQYVILFLILTIAMIVRRQWFVVGITGICTIIPLLAILPVYLSPHINSGEPGSEAIKILFSNVRVKNNHHHQLLDLISKEAPDVIVLVEINNAWLQSLKSLDPIYPNRQIAKGRYYERIVLYSRLPMTTTSEKYFGKYHVPTLIATLDIKNHPLV